MNADKQHASGGISYIVTGSFDDGANSEWGVGELKMITTSNPYLRIYLGADTTKQYGCSCWVSDIKFKTNVAQSTENALEKINRIGMYQFDWKCDGKHQSLGVISQDLEKIIPDGVLDTGYSKQPRETVLIPYMIKAQQEEDSKVEELKSKIISLENRIAMLETKTA